MIKLTGRVFTGIVLVLLLFSMLSCSAAKKPALEDTPPPAPAYLFPTVPEEADMLSGRMARVAESVPGVRGATVVLSHTTAIVALELNPGTRNEKLFTNVAQKLKEEDARVRTVRITADEEMVARIKQVARGIHAGKPVTAYSKEIVKIMRQTPRVEL